MKTIAVKTIGCKLNQYDSQAIAEPFLKHGYSWVKFDQPADVYIINTCTVTGRADYSSRQAVSRAARTANADGNKKGIVVVTGCYAEVDPDALESIEGADLVIGNRGKANIYRIVSDYLETGIIPPLDEVHPAEQCSVWGRAISEMKGYSRAFIKIQDGCNSNCSYCIVPRARGEETSRSLEEITGEIERLSSTGYNEIVLTGVHIGRYKYNGLDFPGLLKEILTGAGPRIRFSSIEPNEINDKLIAVISGNSRFCRHIHIPVQSGSDRILRAMNRGYRAEKIRRIAADLHNAVNGLTLGADFITGFPGETDEDFKHSETIASEARFGYLHVFTYSDRPDTKAARMKEKVDSEVKSKRTGELIRLSSSLIEANLKANIGKTGEVILESRKHRATGMFTGISDNYLRAVFPECSSEYGRLARVRYKAHAGEGKYQYLLSEIDD
ncbi:MAG: tRNA (N(6)-L-threonylcarbamoyladenosine(37)-C(2))-methylthiotransferase MtaB [candidate division Zixibacteria bacterium]|nr:tRNA (N(6)-L-threonylcarbamoyladenosine(37)-C(2))-methylthiotransferase MtaB [candidate division Zixibacteria bacterium]